tara:strand:- start:338 stop:580 length:243 start_codon:yes stop_codon:yes gene_type:complete
MIDFLDTGTIRKIKFNDKVCIQFHPNKRENKTVQDMLKILDAGLERMGVERSILIQTEKSMKKGYPVPCVMLLKYKGEKE